MGQITVDIIIPTYKPDKRFLALIDALEGQTIRPNRIILMNTEEKYLNNLLYGTDFLERHKNVVIKNISKREFNHGRTRNDGAKRSDAEIMIFMTMDAYPADDKLIEELIRPLAKKEVAVSYARQLARDCGPIEEFSRSFNYPEESCIKSEKDFERLGIKTLFMSNVCAAYKRKIFDELHGFTNNTIFNEDMLFAAKVIDSGREIAYASSAKVYHCHEYSGKQQFKRNFDLGVSQADHPEVFGNIKSEGEGIKLVKQTASYLVKKNKIYLIPKLIYISGCKYLGFKKGKNYKKLSKKQILKYTMNREYWSRFWDKQDVPENVYKGYGKNEEGL